MKTLTKQEYEALQKQHEEGCKNNDYSKMIMMGDENDQAMKKYVRDNKLCKHSRIEESQGGQCERCLDCDETWG